MKTIFFRKNTFPSPWGRVREGLAFLFLLLWPFVLPAQNGVTVSNLVMDAGTVTFNVSWKNTGMPAIWSDTVWVWVDYNTAGTMTRLPLSTGATLTTHTVPGVAKVMEVPGNDKGVWVVGNARDAGSFSATVQLLTATSTAAAACVYASNYPPIGKYTSITDISFTGTRPYDVLLKHTDGSSTVTRITGGSYSIPAGDTLKSFTDKTGAPGVITCVASAVYDLKASATAFCTGATVTFALSNTASGRTYQLYKGSTLMNTLTGTGGAATFTGAFAGAGVYTAQVAAEGGHCPAAMTGSHTVSENASPAAPTGASANSRCGAGTVTFSATVPDGITIDWYDSAAGSSTVTDGYGVTSFSPTITTSTTYYAQARNTTTGCVSATRLVVTGTVNALPAAPTGASSNARCGSGMVTFKATPPEGCTIDWYTTATGGSTVSGGYGVSSFSPTITTSTTYYAQARNTTAGCMSATRLAVGGTVNAPVVASVSGAIVCVSGGATLRATLSGSTTTAMTYTWNIGGTQSTTTVNTKITQTLNANTTFTVTVKNSNGCTGAVYTGTIRISTSPGEAYGGSAACGCVAGAVPKGDFCRTPYFCTLSGAELGDRSHIFVVCGVTIDCTGKMIRRNFISYSAGWCNDACSNSSCSTTYQDCGHDRGDWPTLCL